MRPLGENPETSVQLRKDENQINDFTLSVLRFGTGFVCASFMMGCQLMTVVVLS